MSLKETIIYGGAFNPPTLAHQAIVRACVDYAGMRGADVWLMPSASRFDKAIATSRALRLDMIKAMLKDLGGEPGTVEICTLELDSKRPTQTYRTAQELAVSFPDRRFVWVFGTDSVESMPSWYGGEWLMKNLSMLIVERDGSPTILPNKKSKLLGVRTGGISSTEVRRRLDVNEPYGDLVGSNVGAVLAGWV